MKKIEMRCPRCNHCNIVTNRDGKSFCRYCGHTEKREDFEKPFVIKLKEE